VYQSCILWTGWRAALADPHWPIEQAAPLSKRRAAGDGAALAAPGDVPAAVILLYGAANRDPIRFPNPNQFDPERENNQHIGWGGGIHSCVGGPLARLEVNLAFENFIRRVENPRLVEDPPPYRRSPMFRGPQHLWINIDGIKD
jgi:hypothetical protein